MDVFLDILPWKRVLVLTDFLKDFLILGELTTLSLVGVNYLAVDGHLVNAIVSLFQFCSNAKLLLDRGRQTGG